MFVEKVIKTNNKLSNEISQFIGKKVKICGIEYTIVSNFKCVHGSMNRCSTCKLISINWLFGVWRFIFGSHEKVIEELKRRCY